MFKNISLFRINSAWAGTAAQVEDALQAGRFIECAPSQEKSLGWVEPRGQAHGALLEVVNGQWIAQLMIETRALPASVLQRKTQERAAQIEASSGRKPGKKELRDLRDEVRLTLLPQAFTKRAAARVWIDRQARLLVVDAASQARVDEVITLLVQALPGLAVTLIDTQTSPAAAMAGWLLNAEPPAAFSVGQECELKAADESRAVVRYARHRLDIEEVQSHVRDGKLPTRLALTWQDRVSFVLTEALQLKKLAFLDTVFDAAGSNKEDDFDANVAIATGELRQLLPQLLSALGGERLPATS